MPDSPSAEDTVIRIAALKAAKDAAEHMAKQSTSKNPGTVGAFALYTWGALAFMSVVFALALGFSPKSLNFPQFTVASIEAGPKQMIRIEGELPAAIVRNKPSELVPPIETVENEMITDDVVLPLDDMRTGSLSAPIDEELQYYPTEVVPVTLFAVDIGGAKAVSPLIARYASLKKRAPDLFFDLQPRIQLRGRDDRLEARLIAGPFTSKNQVALFCRSVRLRLTIECTPSSFEGDTIQ